MATAVGCKMLPPGNGRSASANLESRSDHMASDEGVVTTAGTSPDNVAQLSLLTLVALHLVPGALVTAGFVALAPVMEAVGFPPIAALLAAILLVLVPVELGVVLWAGRGTGSRMKVIPYRRPLSLQTWLWLVPALIVAAFAGFGIHQVIEPKLIEGLFGWVPKWFVTPISLDQVGDYSTAAWTATFIAFFAINGFVGPIVEELYFRGYLLPRMDYMGRWAPLVNVSLFSLYHFWSPWQLVARILGFGPTVYGVRWKQNVYLGMVVHCSLNSFAVLLVAAMVFGRV
jgi:membrane protease YdiL (CAAX protease family)